jgi:CelD/BcsL family acetyltransferase involved in cellulose biosynthesis
MVGPITKADSGLMRTYFVDAQDSRWRTLVESTVHDVYHFPEYVSLAASHDGGEAVLFVAEDGVRRFLVPLVIRPIPPELGVEDMQYFDAATPYGYPGPLFSPYTVGKDEAFVRQASAAFVAALSAKKFVTCFVRLHTILPAPVDQFMEYGDVVNHGDTISIDLSLPSEMLWRQMRDDHRRDIRKAERTGQIARMDNSRRALDTFIEIYHDTMRRVDASDYYFFSADYFQTLREKLGDHLHLCVVEIDGEIAAAGTFTESCGIVQYQFSGTRADYMNHHPTKAMLHFVTFWGKDRDNQIFHLGGGVGGQEDSLFHFKSGFSRMRHPFYTWRIVVDSPAYQYLTERALAATGMPAEKVENFFPTYRKPIDAAHNKNSIALTA